MPDGSEQLTKRIERLEQELQDAQGKISDLHRRNNIMDKRILEALKGYNADFENRVVQAIGEGRRKGVLKI